ncbi:MAG: SpoIIE family protein phosphatase [Nitrospinae bacterium]|nr:SpoIIE family protein phosphatase [Nitrospinota bacterium]
MPSRQRIPNGRVASFHDNSAHGEDAFIIRELSHITALDAVLDGVTHFGGKDASRFAADSLRDACVESLNDLVTILEAANKTLFQSGRGGFLLTTLSVALKIGDELCVLSAGDSPVYLIREGEIVALTPAAEKSIPPGITSVLGRHAKLSYTSRQVTLQPHDRLVLATDGVTDNVSPTELAALVQSVPSPQEAVSALHDLLREKKRSNRGRGDDQRGFTADDTTVIIRYL